MKQYLLLCNWLSDVQPMSQSDFWSDSSKFPGAHYSKRPAGKKRRRGTDEPAQTGSVENSSSQTGEWKVPRPPQHPPPSSMLAMGTGASQNGGFIFAPPHRPYWMAFNVALERLLDHYLRDKAYSADSLQELGGVQSRLHQQIDERMASRSLHFQHPDP